MKEDLIYVRMTPGYYGTAKFLTKEDAEDYVRWCKELDPVHFDPQIINFNKFKL